ncbi:CR1 protein, partial [Pandion haliaetus]|nr:CR1 protein [Pandion haliaetus]
FSLCNCTPWLSLLLLGSCPSLPRVRFARISQEDETQNFYAVGVTVKYYCRPGYENSTDQLPTSTCFDNLTWSEVPELCQRKSCSPPDIMNGNFNYVTNLQFGVTITYTCNVGYRLVGKPSAQCVLQDNEVTWDNVPYCARISCLPPPAIKNGQLINGDRDFTFGMAVTYRCNNSSFSLIGDATIHCTMDDNLQGIWSGPAPECKGKCFLSLLILLTSFLIPLQILVACKNPEVENGRRLSGFGTVHTYKNTVAFECNPGHLLNGSGIVTCEADNTWKPSLPTCDPIPCGPAPHFSFAELTRAVGDRSPVGTKLKYQCKPGYTAASGKSSVVTCLSDTTWSADPDFCIRQQCTPPTIENGNVIANSFLFETVVTFTCHPGYELKGSLTAKCVVSGNGVDWDTASPYCESQFSYVLCKDPPTIDNGMHNGTKGTDFVYGSVVVYKCKDGFTLAGAASIHCKADHQYHGVWSKPTPECKG